MTKKTIIASLALFIGLFQMYTMMFGQPNYLYFRPLMLTVMMVMGLLGKPLFAKATSPARVKLGNIVDNLLVLVLIAVQVYIFADFDEFVMRQGSPNESDAILGFAYVLIVLELTRRYCGGVLCGLASFFFVQPICSDKLFWIFYGPPTDFDAMIDYVFMRNEGLFSTPLMSVLSYVVPFIIFTSLLTKSGAGDVFMDLARSVAGSLPGGPAKVSIISSAMLGTISGSAVANVVGTGSVTIPLMKKTGYKPEFAGAVEAVASTGGQIMPPVMGAAAFIVAQNLQIAYIQLAAYALIPALMYYIALYFSVHQEAQRLGLKGVPKEELPNAWQVIKKGWSVLVPLVAIVVLMAMGYTPMKAALYAIVFLFIMVMINPAMRIKPVQFIEALQMGAMSSVAVAIGCAAAGLIIAGINVSGMGLKFAGIVTEIAADQMWLALLLTMIVAVILGMGVPTTAVYVTVSVLLSPALIKMGIPEIAAHMFPFYYGVLAAITPPVALASFAAAGIAGTSPSTTGWQAVRLGLSGFIIPFMFTYGPELLLQGAPLDIVLAVCTGCLGVYALSGFIIGVIMDRKINALMRILLGIGAMLMIKPGLYTDIVGLAIVGGMHLWLKHKPSLTDIREGKTEATAMEGVG